MASKLIQLYSDEAATQKAYPICHEKGVFDSEGNESITAIKTTLGNKVDKVSGKGLSTNDYTTTEKNKLGNIEAGANKTIVDSALSGTSTNPVQNKVVKGVLDTHQTNILSVQNGLVDVINNGAKNIIYYDGFPKTEAGMTFSIDTDGGLIVNGTCSVTGDTSAWIYGMYANVEQGVEYSLIDVANSTEGGAGAYAFVADSDVFGNPRTLYDYETHYTAAITKKATITLRLTNGVTYTNKKFKCVICPKSLYDINPSYQPFALPNYDLTRLESQDRVALAEEIDAGAKNKWDFANCGSGNWHTTTSKTDTSFTITSTDTRAYFSMWQSLPAGHYVFSAKISNLSGPDYKGIAIRAGSTSGTSLGSAITFSANGTISGEFTCTATTNVYFVCYASMDTFTSATTYTASDIMVCTKAAFGVSQKFVPYRPNWDLVVSEIGHYMIDNGNTNHSTATYDCSNLADGVYLVAVNRYQNPTTAYGTALYLMTVNDNILPLFTTIVETTDCKATFALSNDKVLSITYPHSAFWQAYVKLI